MEVEIGTKSLLCNEIWYMKSLKRDHLEQVSDFECRLQS